MIGAAQDLGIGSWPARRAKITPHRVALIDGAYSLTYAALEARCAALAGGLRQLGVRPGDRVAYLGPNHPAFLESLFAVCASGAILVPFNIRLAPPEIAYMLADSGASILIHAAGLEELARRAGTHPLRRQPAEVAARPLALPHPQGPSGR